VVVYIQAEQARGADEVAALPEGAVILDWLADYAVLRDQARACAGLCSGTAVRNCGAGARLRLVSGDEQERRKAHRSETGQDHGDALRAQHAS